MMVMDATHYTVETLNMHSGAVTRATVYTKEFSVEALAASDEFMRAEFGYASHLLVEFTDKPGTYAVFVVDTTCAGGLRNIGRAS